MEQEMNIELARAFWNLFAVFSLLPWFPSSSENKQLWLLCTWDYENIKSISYLAKCSLISFWCNNWERGNGDCKDSTRHELMTFSHVCVGSFIGSLFQSPSRLHSYCFSWNTTSMWLLLFGLMSLGQPSEAAKWQAGVGVWETKSKWS